MIINSTYFFFLFLVFNLTYSRWTSSLPSCLWSQRIFPSLPGSRLTFFYRDASSTLLQLVNQWLNFTYSRSHAFRYERKNTNPTLVRIELTTSALAVVLYILNKYIHIHLLLHTYYTHMWHVCMVIHIISKSMDQPGKVANPARGQLNREMNISLSAFAPENLVSRDEFRSSVPRQPAHLHTYSG